MDFALLDPQLMSLTVIAHRIGKAVDNKFITKNICLDISKAFDKMWHWRLLHKLSIYGISGRALSLINTFLTGKSLNAIVNSQLSEALKINVCIS